LKHGVLSRSAKDDAIGFNVAYGDVIVFFAVDRLEVIGERE
jgi:hypothetical protein